MVPFFGASQEPSPVFGVLASALLPAPEPCPEQESAVDRRHWWANIDVLVVVEVYVLGLGGLEIIMDGGRWKCGGTPRGSVSVFEVGGVGWCGGGRGCLVPVADMGFGENSLRRSIIRDAEPDVRSLSLGAG